MRKLRELKWKGFTLVEIMIVVAIIGLLAAIAIPNFVQARNRAEQNACIANLKQIDGAKQIYALDTNTTDTASPAWGQLVTNYIKKTPICKSGGGYAIMSISVDPTCNMSATKGHLL